MSIYLAYAMAAYSLASVYYLLRTRTVGTPFNDSLTPKQLKIKDASAATRRSIFIQGVVGGAVILFFLKPFNKCI